VSSFTRSRRIGRASEEGVKKRAFVILFLSIFINLVGFGIIIPLLPFYGQNLGASPWTVGWLFACYSIAQLIANPWMGMLSDRFGRRPILIACLAGTALSFVMLALAKSLLVLFAARIVDGLSGGNIPTTRAYISDITEEHERAQAMGYLGVAFGLGFIFGPALGGVLVQFDLAAPAWAAACLAAGAMVLAWYWLPETETPDLETHANSWKALGLLPKRRPLMVLLLLDLLLWSCMSLYQTTLPLFGERRFSWGGSEIGYLLALLGLVGAIVQGLSAGWAVNRFGLKNTLLLGIVLTAAGLGAAGMTSSAPPFIAMLVLAIIGSSFIMPSLSTLLSCAARPGEQGRIQGLAGSVESLARTIGPIWGNGVLGAFGGGRAYLSAATVLLLCWALCHWGLPDKQEEGPGSPESLSSLAV